MKALTIKNKIKLYSFQKDEDATPIKNVNKMRV